MVSVHKLLEHVARVAIRLVLAATVLYQGACLNLLVVEHWSHAKTSYHLMTILDILNCILLCACIWLAYFAIRWMKLKRKKHAGMDPRMSGIHGS